MLINKWWTTDGEVHNVYNQILIFYQEHCALRFAKRVIFSLLKKVMALPSCITKEQKCIPHVNSSSSLTCKQNHAETDAKQNNVIRRRE